MRTVLKVRKERERESECVGGHSAEGVKERERESVCVCV